MNKRISLTPQEAEGLLPDGDTIHNFANPGVNLLIGCDYDRQDAIKELRAAKKIELGGEECKRLRHPIVVWDTDKRYTFFEADMAKVEAFESARAASAGGELT